MNASRWPTPDPESWRGRIHAALWPVLDGCTKAEAWLIIDSAVLAAVQAYGVSTAAMTEAEANVRWAEMERIMDFALVGIEADALKLKHPQREFVGPRTAVEP